MSDFSFSIDGIEEFTERLGDGVDKARQAATTELYQFGEELMTLSKERVPVDTGALMNSGQVHFPEVDGDQAIVDVGYGDEAVGYATYVHEDLSPNVHWTRPGSGPKYLENPLSETQDQLPPRILTAYTEAI